MSTSQRNKTLAKQKHNLAAGVENIKLIILDLGGVIRDTSKGLDAGYKAGFESKGFQYNFDSQDTWHLRGIGKYDIAIECFKALLALELRNESHLLHNIIKKPEAETILDAVVTNTITEKDILTAEDMRLKYKEVFNSEKVSGLVSIYPFSEDAVKSLLRKGYKVALLTNGNRVTVDRDVPFTKLFDAIISEDDVKKKKPSGEGLEKIMDRLRFKSSETIFVCDTSIDIRASKEAGSMSAAVLSGMGLKIHLRQENPEMILKDLNEFEKLMHSKS